MLSDTVLVAAADSIDFRSGLHHLARFPVALAMRAGGAAPAAAAAGVAVAAVAVAAGSPAISFRAQILSHNARARTAASLEINMIAILQNGLVVPSEMLRISRISFRNAAVRNAFLIEKANPSRTIANTYQLSIHLLPLVCDVALRDLLQVLLLVPSSFRGDAAVALPLKR